MANPKPFYRINRPFIGRGSRLEYILDTRYAPDRNSLIHAYHLLEKDLIRLFDFIDPTDDNLQTYSHRIYELFLRASTEFETNCTAILNSNGYQSSRNLNIVDYFRINKIAKLDEYSIKINIWTPNPKVFQPFGDWKSKITNEPLTWYQNYNSVKHDRNFNFRLANLENLLLAMSGLFVILFSQFYVQVFYPYQECSSWISSDDGYLYNAASLFSITEISWTEEEKYDFDWDQLKILPDPYDKYVFL